MCLQTKRPQFFVHLFALLFGTGAWVAINGIWVELPILVSKLPEGWNLPAYLTIIAQAGNIGPIVVTLFQLFCKQRLNRIILIYILLSLGICATFILSFTWNQTTYIVSHDTSLPFFILWFIISIVDCTSSVSFLPFMKIFPKVFLTTYFIGEGLSGFVPSVFALVQGAGEEKCLNVSFINQTTNQTDYHVITINEELRFSVEVFLSLVFIMMTICGISFHMLNKHSYSNLMKSMEVTDPIITNEESLIPEEQLIFSNISLTNAKCCYFLTIIFITNTFSNGILPSLSSYSSLPYGQVSYHLSQALGNIANPIACIIALFIPSKSLNKIGGLFCISLVFGSYIFLLALQSPCPVLINSSYGGTVMVFSQFMWVGLVSYLKVSIAQIFHEGGNQQSLLWYGAIVQLASLLGAFTLFPFVQNNYFKSADICSNVCV